MRILHIIESLEFGGAEKVVVHLANRMSDHHEIQLCLTKRKGELVSDLNGKIHVHYFGLKEGNNIKLPLMIRALIKEQKIDVLHVHDWSVYVESVLAVLGTEIKVIQTVHGPYMHYPDNWKSSVKIFLRHLFEKILSKRVCKIISVSNSIKKYIEHDIGINSRIIETIHNGISDVGQEKNTHVKINNVKFVTTGRLAPIKNHQIILKAFHLVVKKFPGSTLTIIGDGPESEALQKLSTSLGLDSQVKFLGFRNDVINILSDHDVFLLSSRYEGISIALLEAMSLSMPSVVTDVGGLPEMVKNAKTGYLVPDNDDIKFSSAMIMLCQDIPSIGLMGKNSRDFFMNEFHENVVINAYEKTYSNCFDHG